MTALILSAPMVAALDPAEDLQDHLGDLVDCLYDRLLHGAECGPRIAGDSVCAGFSTKRFINAWLPDTNEPGGAFETASGAYTHEFSGENEEEILENATWDPQGPIAGIPLELGYFFIKSSMQGENQCWKELE